MRKKKNPSDDGSLLDTSQLLFFAERASERGAANFATVQLVRGAPLSMENGNDASCSRKRVSTADERLTFVFRRIDVLERAWEWRGDEKAEKIPSRVRYASRRAR
jgi:hypothetical protein